MAVFKRGKVWWYKFHWNGESIRESSKQANKRVAEQIEAAHKTSLAKGEVGIRDRKKAPTLLRFAEDDFLPYVRSTFSAKPNTLRYYDSGVRTLLSYSAMANLSLEEITGEKIAGYVAHRRQAGREISTVNRELQALRRMFVLALEWGKTEKALPKVRMLSGEKHRERVLTSDEESRYMKAAAEQAQCLEAAYQEALAGVRATQRGLTPIRPDASLLGDVSAILADCALRPEECFRLKWADNIRNGAIEVQTGKTDNARRRIPLSPRVAGILAMRESNRVNEWVFPAETKSGHIEPSSLRKRHAKACGAAGLDTFDLYTFRHTCLTRWAPHMDPWTLAKLAGHRDMAITKRYIHPQDEPIREAMERARGEKGGHKIGHNQQTTLFVDTPKDGLIV